MRRVKEYTTFGTWPDRFETHLVDEKGKKEGTGIGAPTPEGKRESIDKAYKDLREKRGHY